MINKVMPILRLWWRKREQASDAEARLSERYANCQSDYFSQSVEQKPNVSYNQKGIIVKDER